MQIAVSWMKINNISEKMMKITANYVKIQIALIVQIIFHIVPNVLIYIMQILEYVFINQQQFLLSPLLSQIHKILRFLRSFLAHHHSQIHQFLQSL